MKTISAKPGEIERKWYVVDLEGQVLGRVASRIASVLRGKHKPQFTPHVDTGDFVIAVNADKIVMTGKKDTDKHYIHHTTHPGGLRSISAGKLLVKHPERVIQEAVRRMLPKSALGQSLIKKFKVYAGPEHPHRAQQPQSLDLKQ